jgi:hypothetical protein
MSVYRCDSCENLYDADEVGCNAHPKDQTALLCDGCAEEFACFKCGDYYETNYCKYSDLYYCEGCAI